MQIAKLREQLPKVGDVRTERMTLCDRTDLNPPEKCVVVEVRPDKLWYRVRFERTGTCECYKLPRVMRSEGPYAGAS